MELENSENLPLTHFSSWQPAFQLCQSVLHFGACPPCSSGASPGLCTGSNCPPAFVMSVSFLEPGTWTEVNFDHPTKVAFFSWFLLCVVTIFPLATNKQFVGRCSEAMQMPCSSSNCPCPPFPPRCRASKPMFTRKACGSSPWDWA